MATAAMVSPPGASGSRHVHDHGHAHAHAHAHQSERNHHHQQQQHSQESCGRPGRLKNPRDYDHDDANFNGNYNGNFNDSNDRVDADDVGAHAPAFGRHSSTGGTTARPAYASAPVNASANSTANASTREPATEYVDKIDLYGEGIYTGQVLTDSRAPHGSGRMEYYASDTPHSQPGNMNESKTQQAGVTMYDGEWSQGQWHGHGSIHFANGDSYFGHFEWNLRHGQGTYVWEDGRTYEGGFQQNRRHGADGTLTWPDESSYKGDFDCGQRTGTGEYIYACGHRYKGQWVNSKYEGYGVFTWNDGREYRGEWKHGLRHGQGVEFRTDGGISFQGEWRDHERMHVNRAASMTHNRASYGDMSLQNRDRSSSYNHLQQNACNDHSNMHSNANTAGDAGASANAQFPNRNFASRRTSTSLRATRTIDAVAFGISADHTSVADAESTFRSLRLTRSVSGGGTHQQHGSNTQRQYQYQHQQQYHTSHQHIPNNHNQHHRRGFSDVSPRALHRTQQAQPSAHIPPRMSQAAAQLPFPAQNTQRFTRNEFTNYSNSDFYGNTPDSANRRIGNAVSSVDNMQYPQRSQQYRQTDPSQQYQQQYQSQNQGQQQQQHHPRHRHDFSRGASYLGSDAAPTSHMMRSPSPSTSLRSNRSVTPLPSDPQANQAAHGYGNFHSSINASVANSPMINADSTDRDRSGRNNRSIASNSTAYANSNGGSNSIRGMRSVMKGAAGNVTPTTNTAESPSPPVRPPVAVTNVASNGLPSLGNLGVGAHSVNIPVARHRIGQRNRPRDLAGNDQPDDQHLPPEMRGPPRAQLPERPPTGDLPLASGAPSSVMAPISAQLAPGEVDSPDSAASGQRKRSGSKKKSRSRAKNSDGNAAGADEGSQRTRVRPVRRGHSNSASDVGLATSSDEDGEVSGEKPKRVRSLGRFFGRSTNRKESRRARDDQELNNADAGAGPNTGNSNVNNSSSSNNTNSKRPPKPKAVPHNEDEEWEHPATFMASVVPAHNGGGDRAPHSGPMNNRRGR